MNETLSYYREILKVLKNAEIKHTHHSIGNNAIVGSELWVDVGEKPAERATLESGSQGFSSGNIPNVYA